ncbi:MAG: hypothetical protein VSS75_021565 [Candidatus Parabeggiatoa sp.]|nr:hypothetical protein [Candidatus Parabeggiatoa sp.]
MDIKLEDINQSKFGEQYLSNRKRLSSATGVKLIDNNHLLTASFVGCRLYLIHFDYESKESVVLDSIDTTLDNKLVCPDLLDFNGINGDSTIALSILNENAVLLYELKNNKLFKKAQIKIPRKGKCHGVCFHPVKKNVVLATSNYYDNYLCYIDMETKEVLDYVDYSFKVQDARFCNEKMVIVGVNSFPSFKFSRLLTLKRMLKKPLSFLNIDGKVYKYEDTHFDGIGIINDKIYIADQPNDCVLVINFSGEVENTIKGMSFPHGLDVNANYLAVSNYGTNSVTIIAMENT